MDEKERPEGVKAKGSCGEQEAGKEDAALPLLSLRPNTRGQASSQRNDQEQPSPSRVPSCERSCLRVEALTAETGQKQVCQAGCLYTTLRCTCLLRERLYRPSHGMHGVEGWRRGRLLGGLGRLRAAACK